MGDGVFQGERQRRERLAAARGDLEREEPGRELRLLAAGCQHFLATMIDRGVLGIAPLGGEVLVELVEQRSAGRPGAPSER